MAQYEEKKWKNIEENKKKMKELGILSTAYGATSLRDQRKRKKSNKKKSNTVLPKDVEYIPDEDVDVDLYSDDEDDTRMQNITSVRPHSKKVMAFSGENLENDLPQSSTISMSSMVKLRSRARKDRQQQRESTERQPQTPLQNHPEQKSRQLPPNPELQKQKQVKSKISKTHGQSKKLVAPGSLGAYLRMKEKSKEQLPKKAHVSTHDSDQLGYDSYLDRLKQQSSRSGQQLFDGHSRDIHGFEHDSEDSDNLNDDDFEEDDSEHETAQMINEVQTIKNHTDQTMLKKPHHTRGPSMCKDVHSRSIEDRKLIILNDLCQPIGPDSAAAGEFTRFLGTLARDSNLVPLNKVDWHQVPGKDKIWDYVKTKYIIAEEGKGYALRTVAALWRSYKCRIKTKYYTPYDNMRDRWKHRPKFIPKTHFRQLLKYWSLAEVQDISEKNKEISENQKDRHTAGPISFARKRHELEKTENGPPSEATLYRETRKRKPGKNYKSSCAENDIMDDAQAQKHRNLSGRCTTSKRVKGNSQSGMLIAEEFLQPYKASIVKDTVNEVLTVLQQVLPSDMLDRIPQSFKDPSNYLVNGQSSNHINDLQQCPNTENRDEAKDDDDDALENDDGIQDELQDDDWL